MGYDFYFKMNDGETFRDEFHVSRHNQLLFELIGGENTFTYKELYCLLEKTVKELYYPKDNLNMDDDRSRVNRFDVSETIFVLSKILSDMDSEDIVEITYC